jgi:hypothetical protein
MRNRSCCWHKKCNGKRLVGTVVKGTAEDTEAFTGRLLAVSLQGWTGRYGSRSLRLPECLDSRRMEVVTLLALHIGRLYPSGDILGIVSVRGWVDPRARVRTEGLSQWPHRESKPRPSRRYIPEDSNLRSRARSLTTVNKQLDASV